MSSEQSTSKPGIVIVGGGVAGLITAKRLVGKGHNVTVITSTPYFEWPIAGSYVLARPESYVKNVSGETDHFVKGAKTVVGLAVGLEGSKVLLKEGEAVPFDVLIVATGFKASVFLPKPGMPYQERQKEVQQIGSCIKTASTVLIGGGGTLAVEFAGDVREVNPNAKIILVCKGAKPLNYLDETHAAKLQKALTDKKIEVISNDFVVDVNNDNAVLEKQVYSLNSGTKVEADVFIPAFSGGFNGAWTGFADERGAIAVNEFLQAKADPRVFVVGCSDKEFSAVPKVDAQSKSVSQNVLLKLQNKEMKPHQEGMPTATHPLSQKIGHHTYVFCDLSQMPPPMACCLKCCGFPFCPAPCCWPLYLCGCTPCHPFACGVCCMHPEGSGPAAVLRFLIGGTGSTGIKGLGKPYKESGPVQQKMS